MEHSWFVGFAPADKPEIVVAVLFGNPESWHLRGHEARPAPDRSRAPAAEAEELRRGRCHLAWRRSHGNPARGARGIGGTMTALDRPSGEEDMTRLTSMWRSSPRSPPRCWP